MSIITAKRIRLEPKEDFFSKFPDDIIISVLCRLERIEHRAATSILARRWRYLWKYSACTSLTLNVGRELDLGGADYGDSQEYVYQVNQIVASLGGATNIDEFNLFFNLVEDYDLKYRPDTDRWLSFALGKKVKRLHLATRGTADQDCYSLTGSQVFCNRSINHALSLTSLILDYIKVSGKLLEYILSVSPILEELTVRCDEPCLGRFTVSGPSLKLKHLTVGSCQTPDSVCINSNVNNLESLNYSGGADGLIIKDAPRLVEVRLTLLITQSEFKDFARMLSKLPRLETLELNLYASQSIREFNKFPKFRNLKRLELIIGRYCASCRLCAALLEASPILNQLKIELQSLDDSSKEDKASALSHPHGSLKLLDVTGFTGCQLHMGLLDYLIENTASLEKMVVVTDVSYEKQQATRVLAKTHLEKRLAPGTKIFVK